MQRVLAALSLTAVLTALLVNARQPYLMDFSSFWAAGRLANAGVAAQAYDVAAHHAMQMRGLPIDTLLPFAYPPPYFLFIAPFALPPYPIAAPLWVGATLLLFALAPRWLMPGAVGLALALPTVAICAITGQNGLLTAATFMAALALLKARPALAGVLIGCLVIKPQLAVLIPFALAAGREWKAMSFAAFTTAALCIVSLLLFGVDAWQGFASQAKLMSSIATDNLVGWEKMASVYASLRLVGLPHPAAMALHVATAIAASILAISAWGRTEDPLARAAILAPASLLVSPYLYVYDQTWLAASLAFLARERVSAWMLLGLMTLPITAAVQFGSAAATFNPAPLLSLALLGLVTFRLRAAPLRERRHRRGLQTEQNWQ